MCAFCQFSFGQIVAPPTWAYAASIGGMSTDDARDVTTDNSGNVYVIGTYQGSQMEVGTLTSPNKGGKDIYVAKFSSLGTPIWLKTFGSTTNDVGFAIASDGTNIYWTGTYTNNLYYTPSNFVPIGGLTNKDNIVVCKMDAAGNVLWTNHSGGEGFLANNCYPNDIALLNGGGVIVAGETIGEVKWGTTAVGFTVRDTCYECGFITRYGTNTGEYEWTYTARRPAYDATYDCTAMISQISIDNNNNIYAIGNHANRNINKHSRIIFPNLPLYGVGTPGLNVRDGLGYHDMFMLKIAADGLFLSARNGGYESPGNVQYYTTGSTIWVDKAAQAVYMGGSFQDYLFYSGATGSVASPGYNAFLLKTDLNGILTWEKHSTTSTASNMGGNSLNQISGNGKGGVYVGMSIQADCGWDGQVANGNTTTATVLLARIESNGNTRWVKPITAGSYSVMPPAMQAISSATTDECWMAGPHSGFGIYFDTYLVSGNNYSQDGFIAKLGSSVSEISPQSLSSFSLFPNPSNGSFLLKMPKEDKGEIQIMDATGRIVHVQSFERQTEVLLQTHLNQGMYFVKIEGEKSYESQKVIIE